MRARKYMPWEEIVLWALLGGVFAVALANLGLGTYRWFWNDQAFAAVSAGRMKLYSLAVFGIGTLLTSIPLMFATRRSTRRIGATKIGTKRRG
jgi:hypothetical protein